MRNKKKLIIGICIAVLVLGAALVVKKAVNPDKGSDYVQLLTRDTWISEESWKLDFIDSNTGNFDDGDRVYAFRWLIAEEKEDSVCITLLVNIPGVGTQYRDYDLVYEDGIPKLVGVIDWDGTFMRVYDR